MEQRGPNAGAREPRVPSAVPGCDLRRLPITPTEAYVFSRADGTLTEAELRVCIGLDGLVVTLALERLAALGAIRFADGEPRRTSSQTLPRIRPVPPARPSDAAASEPRRSDVAPKQSAAVPSARPPVTRGASRSDQADGLADLVHRGDTAARGRLWDQAARAYEEAARLAPKNPSVLHKTAGALLRCDEYAAAALLAERAVALSPDRLDTWLLLAHIHHAAGAMVRAREAVDRARQLAPDDVRVARLEEKIPP